MRKNKFSSFKDKGIIKFNKLLSKKDCKNINNLILKNRNWGKELFIDEKDFLKQKKYKKINPGKNIQNLANKFDLNFIEKNSTITRFLRRILGNDYRIILSKFIVSIPYKWMPKYVKELDKKDPVKNLNKFIKKKYRDVTYFQGLDFHMDSIDRPHNNNKFITLYAYLDKVSKQMSPLEIVEASHKFGHDTWPHYIKKNNNSSLHYSPDNKKFFKLKKSILSGNMGDVFIWTSNTLHGTSKPGIKSKKTRISLRYLIEKTTKKKTLIDDVIIQNRINEVVKKYEKN
tara:strand:+ start:28128 stop:28985 length:858 start_codon:yes stop_codon:yes gene_type:complete